MSAQTIVLPATSTLGASGGSGGSLGGGGGGGRVVIQETTYNAGSIADTSLAVAGGTGSQGGSAGAIGINAGSSVVGAGQSLVISGGRVGSAAFTTGNFNVQTGGQLTISNSDQSVGTFSGGGNANLTGSALTVGVGNVSSTFAGTLASDSSLTKTGAGTFNVAGSVNLGGAVTVSAGTLNVAAGGSIATSGDFTNSGRVNLADSSATLVGQNFNNQAGATLGGSGTITAALINSGTVRIGANDDLIFTGTGNSNKGTIAVQGGILEFTKTLTNNLGGSITGHGTIFTNEAGASSVVGLTNAGSMTFSGGPTDIYGNVTNQSGGAIFSAGGGVLTFHNDLNFQSGGTIQTDVGSRTVVFGTATLKGNFTGGGTVELDGKILIDPQLISVGGDFTFGHQSTFVMDVEGTTRGTQYDSFDIAGLATLGGTLQFTASHGFVPSVGQRFLAVSYGSRSGIFDSIVGFGLTSDEFLTVDYEANGLYLIINSTSVPEPSSLLLLGSGLAGAGAIGYQRRRGSVASRTV